MAAPFGDIVTKLEHTVAAFVKQHRLPGAAAGVVHGDDLVWSTGYGFADVASRRAPDARTLYRIASITKTFTATAILQLRDEGRLHLDDPAVTHLPELKDAVSPFGRIETVTIRRLLSHESGLVGDPPGTDWTFRTYEDDPLVNLGRVGEIATTIPPNAQNKYSNLGFQLLGEIVTRVSGTPYVEYLRANVLDPLHLTSTAFEPLPMDLLERCATGYQARWMSDELHPADPFRAMFAEGGLWSCVEDLARWIAAQFREEGSARDGEQILAGSSLKEMHIARYLGNEKWTEAWCIGWYAVRKDDTVWVQHSGGLPGFITNLCFHVKERVGAIALLNGEAEAAELAMTLGALALDQVRAQTKPAEPPSPLPIQFVDLLGLYASEPDGLLFRCEWRDGKLALIDPDTPEWLPVLEPTEIPDRFVVSAGWRESGEPVIFRRASGGEVTGVTIGPFSLVRYGPVIA
jgi:CubicO group peptidase (beta-lactamase class C family)